MLEDVKRIKIKHLVENMINKKKMNNTINSSGNLSLNDSILLINTIFTLITPLLLLCLKLIKRCQCGRDNYIETRNESSTQSPTIGGGTLSRIASVFRGGNIQTSNVSSSTNQ